MESKTAAKYLSQNGHFSILQNGSQFFSALITHLGSEQTFPCFNNKTDKTGQNVSSPVLNTVKNATNDTVLHPFSAPFKSGYAFRTFSHFTLFDA